MRRFEKFRMVGFGVVEFGCGVWRGKVLGDKV